MDDTRIAAIAGILANTVFDAEDCTKDGTPTVAAIEREIGHDITAQERDAAWEVFQAALSDAEVERDRLEAELAETLEGNVETEGLSEADVALIAATEGLTDEELAEMYGVPVEALEPAPGGEITILVRKMYVSRLPLTVHGVGTFTVVEGEPITLPAEAIDALRNSDITFEEV